MSKRDVHVAIRRLLGPPDPFVARRGKDGRILRGRVRVSNQRTRDAERLMMNPSLIHAEGGAYRPFTAGKVLSATQARMVVQRAKTA